MSADLPGVLIVDDVEANLVALGAQLEALECTVVRARSGNDALRLLLKEEFAVILLDVQMPEMDGYEVARLARENPDTKDVPIIFVTAMAENEENLLRGYGTGAVDVIFKPVNAYILRSKVQVFIDLWLGRRKLAAEVEAHRRTLEEVERKRKDLTLSEAQLRRANEEIERISREQIADEQGRRATAETALRSTEEQLRQAQKMEAVGRLAGGVAHDFNNLLSIILSYSSLILADLEGQSPIREDLEEIRKAGVRASDLTRQLLAFSRQQVLEPRVIDLNEVAAGMRNMFVRLVGEDVEVALSATATGKVLCDPGQIEQVLMNLVVNARDAMPDGGTVTIETTDVELDAIDGDGLAGPTVRLSVADTGHGMDAKTAARVFEPFFTTKEQGKGTGLGLSTVYGIVRQSGGTIHLESEPGKGTVFHVYFPRTDDARTALTPAARPSSASAASETVLLVEDDPQLRTLVSAILGRHGYRILVAADGEEALRISDVRPDVIDVVLTDVVMPRMSGPAFVERIARTRPDARVIFMSGYTEGVVAHEDLVGRGAFLQKPVVPETLLTKLREVIEAPRGLFEARRSLRSPA